MLCTLHTSIVAQKEAVDTVWFSASEVEVLDKGLLEIFESVNKIPVGNPFSVWYFELDSAQQDSVLRIDAHPSHRIFPEMAVSDGYFYCKKYLVLISPDVKKAKHADEIFKYTNKEKKLYCFDVDWDLFMEYESDEQDKYWEVVEDMGNNDYSPVTFIRHVNGTWSYELGIYW